ncbi:MAG: glycosyltransferase family 2 protein [Lachnospiraceae bacterium]|nr:glycosyltransferase family 2 protein [Lachnospiraceae bacterium]
MYTYILMLQDFFTSHHVHWFMIFFTLILLRWAIIFFNMLRYKPYTCENKDFFTSVIIPVLDEPEDLFADVIAKIGAQHPSEIIVLINGPKNEKLESICRRHNALVENGALAGTQVRFYHTPIPGKRNAIREALEQTDEKSDIAILVDSDTIWTEGTLEELLRPFSADDKIGGVTTRQKILKPERCLITMFADMLEDIRAEGSMKAMSAVGKVGCLPGRTIAFRTSILRAVIDEFMNEVFMGIHKEVSDDRSLTNLTLEMGYKTVMQDTSVVYTDAPLQWKKFMRQQLRWSEGSQYNNIRMTPWMAKHAKLMCFIYWTDMLFPMLLISVYVNMATSFVLRHLGHPIIGVTYNESFLVTLILIILGCMLGFGVRNLKVFARKPFYYTLLIPVFIVILTIIMTPIRILGLMRCADGLGWGTRNLQTVTETSSDKPAS